MQAAKKATKATAAHVNNINSETITSNNINFENISAANEQTHENINSALEQMGKFGFDYITYTSNVVSQSIKSAQALNDITSEFTDEIYNANAKNLRESLTCTSFSQIADLTENTINQQINSITRYSNDLMSLLSLNFDKIINEV
ncbi:MAG: hypothetical protein J0G32_02295 [Alphaproteobacteria bacterium]|nr:hypothetical protein [Alphaproteobacteria bacterium]OJV15735.1 MAG: hypothetical protein BGO27_07455 [Alphaproteobacteria bacterium 33-17]